MLQSGTLIAPADPVPKSIHIITNEQRYNNRGPSTQQESFLYIGSQRGQLNLSMLLMLKFTSDQWGCLAYQGRTLRTVLLRYGIKKVG